MAISTTAPLYTATDRAEHPSLTLRLFRVLEAHGRARALRWLDQQSDEFLAARGLDRAAMERNLSAK